MRAFLTAAQAADIPSLRGLPDEARDTVLADADRVERYVSRNPWIDEDSLRAYGERNDLPPDRLNAALAFLTDTRRLLTIGE